LQKATDKPIKITFNLHEVDGYLPPADEEQFVWAVKSTDADFKAKRPSCSKGPTSSRTRSPTWASRSSARSVPPRLPLLVGRCAEQVHLPVPRLGIHEYRHAHRRPAPRGLDPLPLRDVSGKAELTWIEYKQNTPDHIVLRIG